MPRLASDPFGAGWNLFGTPDNPLPTDPLTITGRAFLQVLILAAAGVLGAIVVGRRARRRARAPGLLTVATLTAVAGIAVSDV